MRPRRVTFNVGSGHVCRKRVALLRIDSCELAHPLLGLCLVLHKFDRHVVLVRAEMGCVGVIDHARVDNVSVLVRSLDKRPDNLVAIRGIVVGDGLAHVTRSLPAWGKLNLILR